jgi:uncharacterized protein YaaN involved in tellurite resistance
VTAVVATTACEVLEANNQEEEEEEEDEHTHDKDEEEEEVAEVDEDIEVEDVQAILRWSSTASKKKSLKDFVL